MILGVFFVFFLVAFLFDWEGNRFDMISFGEFTRYDGEGVLNEGDHITKITPVFS